MVGALLPSPPLYNWVVVVLRPHGLKLFSMDRSACSWIEVVIAVVVLACEYWVPN